MVEALPRVGLGFTLQLTSHDRGPALCGLRSNRCGGKLGILKVVLGMEIASVLASKNGSVSPGMCYVPVFTFRLVDERDISPARFRQMKSV